MKGTDAPKWRHSRRIGSRYGDSTAILQNNWGIEIDREEGGPVWPGARLELKSPTPPRSSPARMSLRPSEE